MNPKIIYYIIRGAFQRGTAYEVSYPSSWPDFHSLLDIFEGEECARPGS